MKTIQTIDKRLDEINKRVSKGASKAIKAGLDHIIGIGGIAESEAQVIIEEIILDIDYIVKNADMPRNRVETHYLAQVIKEHADSRSKIGDYKTASGLISVYSQLEEWINLYKPRIIEGKRKLKIMS